MVLSLRVDGDSCTAELAGQGGVYLDPVAAEGQVGGKHWLRAGRKDKKQGQKQGFHRGSPNGCAQRIGQPKAARQRAIWART